MIAPYCIENASKNAIIAYGKPLLNVDEFYGSVPCNSVYEVKQIIKFAKNHKDKTIIIHGVNEVFADFFIDEKLMNIQIPMDWYERKDLVIVLNEVIKDKIKAGGTAKAVISEILTYIGIDFGQIRNLPNLKSLLNNEYFKAVNPEITQIFTEFENGLKVYKPHIIVNDIYILFSFNEEKIKAEFPLAYEFLKNQKADRC